MKKMIYERSHFQNVPVGYRVLTGLVAIDRGAVGMFPM